MWKNCIWLDCIFCCLFDILCYSQYYFLIDFWWTYCISILLSISNAVILSNFFKQLKFSRNWFFFFCRYIWPDDTLPGWLMVNVQDTIGTLVYFWINYSFLGFFVGIAFWFLYLLKYSQKLVDLVNESVKEESKKYIRIKKALVELIGLRIYQNELVWIGKKIQRYILFIFVLVCSQKQLIFLVYLFSSNALVAWFIPHVSFSTWIL